jgi:RNA-directed DNA polymerase
LNHTKSNLEKLSRWKLPVIHSTAELAEKLEVSLGEIRFLSFSRDISKTHHYKRFFIQKKSGGTRLISAPMPRLKKVQKWILENILNLITPKDVAHGFIKQKSIVTNARPHVGAEVVINMDLKDFFPSITYPRVKGVFESLGYSEAVATTLSLICTQPDVDEAELDTETWYIANGERFLPQGASTSPAITNILCQKLDNRLLGISKKLGFNYTRYADDLTFSASGEGTKNINALKGNAIKIIENEGFVLHPDKLQIMRKGAKKEVTGVVVNQKTSVDRTTLRKFRALLHNIEKTGLKDKKWGNSNDVKASMQGYANYVMMVDEQKGKTLKKQVKEVLKKYG